MTDHLEAAIEAGARAQRANWKSTGWFTRLIARGRSRVVINAALPHIRAMIADEIDLERMTMRQRQDDSQFPITTDAIDVGMRIAEIHVRKGPRP